MAKDSNPVVPGKDPASGKAEQPTPDWEKVLYDPKRIEKYVRGEMTLQELHAVSGPEMLELAKVGFSMFEHGQFNDAKVVFEGLNALDPKEAYYLTALGAVHLMLEDLEMAERCFNGAIELDGKELASYVNRGEVFLRQGKILEAAQDFKKAVDLDPENKDPLTQRARILAAAALETLEAAEQEAKNQGKAGSEGRAPSKSAKKPASKSGSKAAGKKK